MDVRMPDGTVVKNVPMGITQEELLARYERGKKIGAWKQEAAEAVATAAEAPLIGAGKKATDVIAGIEQAAHATKGDTNAAEILAANQAEGEKLYAPLREKHPFLTGAGESAYLTATPVGQATTLGRVAAPTIAAIAQEALAYGSPEERARNAAGQGVAALAGGVAGEGVRRAVAPLAPTLTQPQQRAITQAETRLGVKARPSQLTGNQNLANIEDTLAQSPGGSGVWAAFNEANKAKINRAAAQSFGSVDDAPTAAVMAANKVRLQNEYEALRAATKMPVVGPVFDAIDKAEQMLGRGASVKGKGEAAAVVANLKEQLWNTKELSGADYQAWTSDLSSLARSTDNGTVRAALRQVEKAMDKAARENNAARWELADKQWAALKTLMRPNAVNQTTGDVSPRGVAMALQVTGKDTAKLGGLSGPLQDIADYGRALPALREGSQTARRGAFADAASYLVSPLTWAASKGMTSDAGRAYLAGGLTGNPELSRRLGGLLGMGSIPLSISEIERLLGERRQ